MHDLILRNRVVGYREGDLMRHLHGHHDDDPAVRAMRHPAERRTAFEHHLPDTHVLVAFPVEAWPHLRAAMRARTRRAGAWSGRLTPAERKLAPELLAEIQRRGPLSSAGFEDKRRAHRVVWGASSLVKSTLQKLFFHGELLIAERDKNRRRYDLPANVIPAHIAALPEASPEETRRWLVDLKLKQRRLVLLKRDEVPIVEDLVQPIAISGCPLAYGRRDDGPLLEETLGSCEPPGFSPVRLLAPLDPLIYDRRLTAALWNFDYTWEAYTPPAKRRRGHYALPVLAGTELVGHVEPKADRTAGKLQLASRAVRGRVATAAALQELAAWLGLRR
jgi:uncharacterized protein YcaQ